MFSKIKQCIETTLKNFFSKCQLLCFRWMLVTFSKECICISSGKYLDSSSATKKPLAKSLKQRKKRFSAPAIWPCRTEAVAYRLGFLMGYVRSRLSTHFSNCRGKVVVDMGNN